MTIVCHHGANGGYKTSGVIQDHAIPDLKKGRVVVSNIRGFTRERVWDVITDIHRMSDLIYVDTSSSEGREKMARWFHWVPPGALIILDEVQLIYRKGLRDSDLKKFDYPGGIDKAKEDKRPVDFHAAFDQHRHFNWDIILITPSIDKIHLAIRGTTEGAYYHKNRATVGLPGSYLEGVHDAQDSGKSSSHFNEISKKKIKKETFACYDSTSTGNIKDTFFGFKFWKNPKLVLLTFGSLVIFYLMQSGTFVDWINSFSMSIVAPNAETINSSTEKHTPVSMENIPPPAPTNTNHVASSKNISVSDPLIKCKYLYFVARFTGTSEQIMLDCDSTIYTSETLNYLGVKVVNVKSSFVILGWPFDQPKNIKMVFQPPPDFYIPDERRDNNSDKPI